MFIQYALLCACPRPTEPGDISQLTCIEDFGQIQKIILQRRYSSGTTENTIAFAADAVELLATWQALQQATDGTKVVWSNTLGEPTNTPGAPITFGSGNQVPNGVPIVTGRESTAFNALMYSHTQAIVKQMKEWQCEEAAVYFVNADGQIAGKADDLDSPSTLQGFPIQLQSFFVGDKQFGGFGEPDRNALQFSLKPNWSDDFYVVTPQFDALAGIYD